MKILVVCQFYKPEPFRISDICESLVRQGHEILVVTGLPNYPEGDFYPGYEDGKSRDEMLDGVRVHRCAIHPRHRGAIHRFWNYYSFVCASKRYLARLREEFDVVFVNQLSPVMMAEGGILYAKKHRKKVVLYCLDLWPESLLAGGVRRGSLLYRAYWHVSRHIYNAADTICVTSHGFEPYLIGNLRLPRARLEYLPQYAEALFEQVAPLQMHEPPYYFTFAGNIGQAQSVETIIQTAARLVGNRKIHFNILGGGSNFEKCRKMADGLDNITFYGRKNLSEMPVFYEKSDIMLITFVADNVLSCVIPGKVSSYLAAGRGVLGAINGETPLVIREANCGICVEAEDAEALANAAIQITEHPEQIEAYGKNARKYYLEFFSKRKFLTHLTDTLEDAIM